MPIYSYKNKLGGWNVLKDKYIQLLKSGGKINFVFMESFIAELEAYFFVTGLKDTQLSIEEKQVLEDFDMLIETINMVEMTMLRLCIQKNCR